ncbi:hypothetical protein [Micromonospora sediminimaris]|uniref:Uncharacterized protein n=1 Tax=Micromonospora sediminimaris TaxID=547162 RepID=A0A9W5UVG4_9ACTN|nr:hypothetical protein [Micromonospora sediminimaris]GIJ35791.1 hypothetical protein Vse01_49390 [Micromonospora sediminimaris]SFC56978.1 hypothetical protein SAMN05216284_105277 [Micromonospora sediminimaris]
MRTRVAWYLCPTTLLPVYSPGRQSLPEHWPGRQSPPAHSPGRQDQHETYLPQRRRGTHLPKWMREPTRPLPMPRPGRPGWLTPGQQWRANGGQW